MGAIAATAAIAMAQTAPPAAPSSSSRADNYYAAGNRIDITSPMPRDVIVAAREVDIRQPVAGDIVAAGWRVTVAARAEDDVRLAGSELIVNAPVAGDLTVAGGDVAIGGHAHIAGRSWLTGKTVRIEGIVDRDVQVAAANVVIAGDIRHSLRVVAEHVELLPSARVRGPFAYKAPSKASIADGAVVDGPITYEAIPQQEAQRARAWPVVSSVFFAIHLILAGLLIVAFLPDVERPVIDTLRANPGRSVAAGLVFVATTPVVAVLLIVSFMGLPLGLVLAALYGIALFAGVVVTAFLVGDAEGKLFNATRITSRSQQAMLLVAGVVTLAVLRSVLGGLVVFASIVVGVGALMLWITSAYTDMSQRPVG